jgi:hypothetical protein
MARFYLTLIARDRGQPIRVEFESLHRNLADLQNDLQSRDFIEGLRFSREEGEGEGTPVLVASHAIALARIWRPRRRPESTGEDHDGL